MGAEIRDMELPVPTDRTLQSAESYAFHADFVARTPELYQPETLRRIRTGQNVSPDVLLRCRSDLEQARRDIKVGFRGCGCAGHSDDADCGACDRGTERESRSSASRGNCSCCEIPVPLTFGGCPRFQSLADSPKPAYPSGCRSSDHTGEKPGSCRSPTRMSRRQPGTSGNRCHPERRIAFRLRNAIRSRRTPMYSADVSRLRSSTSNSS